MKINCPFHEDRTASCHVYKDHYFCFGCQKTGPVTELPEGGKYIDYEPEPKPQEDLALSFARIESLPRKEIRGFSLPYDDRGYYLVWPDRSYYTLRLFDPGKGSKYLCPSGHKRPHFLVQDRGYSKLALIEGEFNALSLGQLGLPVTIISPGGAGAFQNKLEPYLPYKEIHLFVDNDGAGALAAIAFKAFMTQKGHLNVIIHLLSQDANEVLTTHGREKLKEEYCRYLGVQQEAVSEKTSQGGAV